MRAIGGNITYTDSDGLNPSLTPYENGYVIHTFLSSEDLIVSEGGDVEYLIVAGGGAGGTPNSVFEGGGGGAGGVLEGSIFLSAGTYNIVVGGGGTPLSVDGENSSFDSLIAYGGGGGGSAGAGRNGGSGGGATYPDGAGGTGVVGQGHDGEANHFYLGETDRGCGGGGAGEVGGTDLHAYGGDGIESSISGIPTYYGGGGGGLGWDGVSYYSGVGGQGGGGNGANTLGEIGQSGTPNTGGGGGGGSRSGGVKYLGGNGGSGIVIIRFPFTMNLQLISVNPSAGYVGDEVVITGEGFDATTTVTFSGSASATISEYTSTTITVTVPDGATSGPITVTKGVHSISTSFDFAVGTTDRYWVGGTGIWESTTNWSYSSGGSGGYSIPTSADNVHFDANSFTDGGQTVTVSAGVCNSMTWNAVPYLPSLLFGESGYITTYGDITLYHAMYLEYTAPDLNAFAHSSFMLEYTPVVSRFKIGGDCHLATDTLPVPPIEVLENGTLYLTEDTTFTTLWVRGDFDAQGYNITAQGIKFEPADT